MSQINLPRITNFQINLFNGNIIHRPVSRFVILSDVLRNYSRNYIAEIIFYFNDPENSYHTLTLRNSLHNNIFIVEFFNRYNHRFEKIELSNDEKIADYQSVIDLILRTRNLNEQFGRFIINPWHRQPVVA